MRNLTILALLCAALCTSAGAKPILIQGADVYSISHGVLKNTDIKIVDGKIAALGTSLDCADCERVNASGKRVYPGLVHANTLAGLTEIAAVRAMSDYAEVGNINPNARAQTAINPDSELLPVLRAQGLTTLHVVPQGGALFTGTTAVIQPSGWTIEQMRLLPEAGAFLAWPSVRMPEFVPKAIADEAIKAAVQNKALIKQTMMEARAYMAADRAGKATAPDLRWRALMPVLAGTRKLFIGANEVTQLREATRFCEAEKLRCVIVGAQDAWRIPAEIKQAKVELILGSPFNLPETRSEGFDQVYALAASLHQAGIQFAISGDGNAFAAPMDGNLAFNAAQYAAFGLPDEIALRAITLTPAEILGVDKLVGSIDVGKQADLVIASGDLLEISSRVEAVYIKGLAQEMKSRHTNLRDKYLRKLGQ
jgi:imidazolonepropionase-like amidohydrolase